MLKKFQIFYFTYVNNIYINYVIPLAYNVMLLIFWLMLIFLVKIIIIFIIWEKYTKNISVEEFNKGLNQYDNQIIYGIKDNIDDEINKVYIKA